MGGLARLYTFDRVSIPNTNVVLAFALTPVGRNVILTGRVLDKEDPNVVLYERSVVDTPGSDPTLTTADAEQFSGMRLAFSPEASGAGRRGQNGTNGFAKTVVAERGVSQRTQGSPTAYCEATRLTRTAAGFSVAR